MTALKFEICVDSIAGVRSARDAGAERVELCGNLLEGGTTPSLGMILVARKVAATLASTGTPAFFVHPAEASHGDLGMITAADAVLALSNSGETAELADDAGRLRRDDAVERRGQQRQLEPVGTQRPRDVHVVGVPRPPGRDDRDLIEAIGPTSLLATADFYFHSKIVIRVADGTDKRTTERRRAATIAQAMLAVAR